MRPRRFLAGVESLEPREVLSALGMFSGHGAGDVIARQPLLNGSYETATTLHGTSRTLGAFTGQLVTGFAVDQYHVLGGLARFTDAAGDSVLATVSGSYQKPRRGLTHISGTLNFTIVGGTGALSHATGRGQLFISQNVENEHLKFTVTGGGGI